MSEEKLTNKNIKFIAILLTICSIIITILNNTNIDQYIRLIIIPIAILLISYMFIIKKIGIKTNKKAYYYLLPILLILFSYLFIDIDESNMLLNIIVLPITISLFFLTLVNNNYALSKQYLFDFLKIFPGKLFSNLGYLNLIKNKKENSNKKKYNTLIGCLIGVPIAIVILILLSSGDKYFSTFLNGIIGFVEELVSIDNIISNIFIFSWSFIILFSIFFNIIKSINTNKRKFELKESNSSIAATILIIVNSAYTLFLISEISKLTTNFLNLPVEYTYAEYAREGFFQLLIVTTINISIIAYFTYYTNLVKDNKLVKMLLSVLTIFSLLLILNSYYRMFLYIGVYGFTILRLQVVLFLLMELILFIIIFGKIININFKSSAFKFMIIVISTYILNLYLCTNTFIDFINNLFNLGI